MGQGRKQPGDDERSKLLAELAQEEQYVEFLEMDVLGRMLWDEKQWQFITDTDENGDPLNGIHELAISGLNQGGKSTSLCGKFAYHLSGRYPKNWPGRRWDHPIVAAIGGETASTTRDLLTDRLLGPPERRGSGFIPAECFNPERDIIPMRQGIKDQIEWFQVKHYNLAGEFDGYSKCFVFAYSAGWERIAGYTLHEIGCDEEMKFEIYDEFSARLNFTRGYFSCSFTPLLGETDFYLLFERGGDGLRKLITFGIDDADHLDQKHREFLKKKYAGHPLEDARLRGLPIRGRGLIYTVPDELISIEDFNIPESWPQIIGVDFPHTTGRFTAVRMALNPLDDTLYVVSCYRASDLPTEMYASRLRAMGGGTIPVAWPHDGGRRDTSGSTVAERYRQLGIRMLHEHAHVIDPEGHKSHAIWEAIELILDRMRDGRFRVFASCKEWFDEKRKYRHEKGKVAQGLEDDLIDATHKGVLMLRFAESPAGMRESPAADWRRQRQEWDFYGG